jgi:glycine/D-amino acid oxidase-like deaminating enzyme
VSRPLRVAVLGAGIMGASTALFLARRGARVTLFDAAKAPFSGASRWNEGKIHLGFLYSADPSLRTARKLLPGGLAFRDLVEELVGRSLEPAIAPCDDLYLVHRGSVTGADAAERYYRAVAGLVRQSEGAGRYLTDASRARIAALSGPELDATADTRVVRAGYRVPERSVSTRWIADRYLEALASEPGIELRAGTRVTAAKPADAKGRDRWRVVTDSGDPAPYDYVVNALWEGRVAVDRTVGMEPEAGWSHRFRLSLFVHTARPLDVPSAVIGTGPYGDVKNYTGRDFYLSWYPAGLVAYGREADPPTVPALTPDARAGIETAIWTSLGELLPPVRAIAAEAETVDLRGGWVFALGHGSLADRRSTLHRRDRVGVRRHGSYFSIDTGKYSIAPWLARQVAESILGG